MGAVFSRTKNDSDIDLENIGGNADRLAVFRELVGISDVLGSHSRRSKRNVRNVGIYNRVVAEEREAKTQYIFSALLINTCLLAQVVFASALTALGAGNGSHTQITVLGAANTVIAAVLTFTKGQGLPNRLRQYQCSLRKLREHIEQRERDFAQSSCRLDMDVELQRIIGMYEQIRQNDENNDPSSYHATPLPSTNDQPLVNDQLQKSKIAVIDPDNPLTPGKVILVKNSKEELDKPLPTPGHIREDVSQSLGIVS